MREEEEALIDPLIALASISRQMRESSCCPGRDLMLASPEVIDLATGTPGEGRKLLYMQHPGLLDSIDIVADGTLPAGAWKVKRDGETLCEGNVLPPEGMDK